MEKSCNFICRLKICTRNKFLLLGFSITKERGHLLSLLKHIIFLAPHKLIVYERTKRNKESKQNATFCVQNGPNCLINYEYKRTPRSNSILRSIYTYQTQNQKRNKLIKAEIKWVQGHSQQHLIVSTKTLYHCMNGIEMKGLSMLCYQVNAFSSFQI